MTKAQQVFEKVEAMIASGSTKADAFKALADEFSQPVDSIRGSYYTHTRKQAGTSGATRRPRKRETTAQDAVDLAVAALERAIESIDAEIEAAKVRACLLYTSPSPRD